MTTKIDSEETYSYTLTNDGNHLSALGQKFKKSDWDASEKQLSEREKEILNCLYDLGKDKQDSKINYYCISEKNYLHIRPLIEKFFDLDKIITNINDKDKNKDNEKEPKKVAKKGSKKDQLKKLEENCKSENIIIENNSKIILIDIVNDLLDKFKKFKLHFALNAIQSKYCEIRGLGFMFMCVYLLKNTEEYFSINKHGKKMFKILKIYDFLNILVATDKFINAVSKDDFVGLDINSSLVKKNIQYICQ